MIHQAFHKASHSWVMKTKLLAPSPYYIDKYAVSHEDEPGRKSTHVRKYLLVPNAGPCAPHVCEHVGRDGPVNT